MFEQAKTVHALDLVDCAATVIHHAMMTRDPINMHILTISNNGCPTNVLVISECILIIIISVSTLILQ
jgi:hypothetical protein